MIRMGSRYLYRDKESGGALGFGVDAITASLLIEALAWVSRLDRRVLRQVQDPYPALAASVLAWNSSRTKRGRPCPTRVVCTLIVAGWSRKWFMTLASRIPTPTFPLMMSSVA